MGRKLKTSTITVSKEATVNFNNCTDSTDEDKSEKRESSPQPVNLIRVQEVPQDPILQAEDTKAPTPRPPSRKKDEKMRCEHCNKSVSYRCLKYYHRCKASEKQETASSLPPVTSPTPKRPMRPRAETMIEPESHTPPEGYPSTERISQALANARSMQARRQKDSIYDRLTFS